MRAADRPVAQPVGASPSMASPSSPPWGDSISSIVSSTASCWSTMPSRSAVDGAWSSRCSASVMTRCYPFRPSPTQAPAGSVQRRLDGDDPADDLHQPPPQVQHDHGDQQLEVPRRLLVDLAVGRLGTVRRQLPGVGHDPTTRGARAVGLEAVRVEEPAARLAPGHRSRTRYAPAARAGTRPLVRAGTRPLVRAGTRPLVRAGTRPLVRAGTRASGRAGTRR